MSSRVHFITDRKCLWETRRIVPRATLHIVAAFDAEFFQLRVQSSPLEPETLRRAIAAANLPLGFAQHSQNVFAFCCMQCGVGVLQLLLLLREDAAGTYAAQALGRKMLIESRRGSSSAAIDAEDYLRRFPSGSYADAAKLILKQ